MDGIVMCRTVDGATVPVTVAFIEQHMDNRILPRLLGLAVDNDLTTSKPSKDDKNCFTIFQDLGVASGPLLRLMQFFRTGSVPNHLLQEMYETSLRLGGFSQLDHYMAQPPPPPPPPHAPCSPQEDLQREFEWTVCHMNVNDNIQQLVDKGWSAAAQLGCIHVYMKRPMS
jgi:hypothetical protein